MTIGAGEGRDPGQLASIPQTGSGTRACGSTGAVRLGNSAFLRLDLAGQSLSQERMLFYRIGDDIVQEAGAGVEGKDVVGQTVWEEV